MMLPCDAPGCPNLAPTSVVTRETRVLCAFHAAEIRPPEPTITAQPSLWETDPLAALRDAMPALEAVREWNRQVARVADMVADPHRVYGLVVEVSQRNNTVAAHQHAAVAHDRAYVVDLDALTINRAPLNLTDIPFTTERTEP